MSKTVPIGTTVAAAAQSKMVVQMFGGFSISFGDGVFLLEKSRSNKALYLLQYLMMHRSQGISRSALAQLLYSNSEVENPTNALKIAIHRMRKMLADAGASDQEYILFKKGVYFWNNELECEIDAESFEQIAKRASDTTLESQECLELYQAAERLYKGDFLPMSASEDWVAIQTVRYQNMYLECVGGIYRLLSEKQEFEPLLKILERAIKMLPYHETVYVLYISCLFEMKRFQRAIEVYNAVATMLFQELGVTPSEELVQLHQKLNAALKNRAGDLPEIMETLQEEAEEKGAYYCDYLTFIESYRILLRTTERTGLSAFLLFCTLTESGNINSADQKKILEAASVLQSVIKGLLRRGDVYTRNGPNQFLILLLGIKQENCADVFERIKTGFSDQYHGRGIRLSQRTVTAASMQNMTTSLRFSRKTPTW